MLDRTGHGGQRGGMQGNPNLRTPDDDGLSRLADDLEEMRRHLDHQVRRMDGIVDRIQAGWQGTTGSSYRDLHRGSAKDAVRIRETLRVVQEAILMSRDGFRERELDVLATMRKIQSHMNVEREADALQAPPVGRSSLDDL
ncbi:WXG100 family type VII secretion target [Streptomyces xanthochromogenes]|uniref:WXG100 family type VII secretion target n=1 Tax=Streptomyces xanthochromogenes TaxID=67384 RepID=UPI00343DC123